jgi:hypothetical protein
MTEVSKPIQDQLARLRAEIEELETSTGWRNSANLHGSRQLRSIASRIVLSAKRLEALVKEETFSR